MFGWVTYSDRLDKLKLPTLAYRTKRGDTIKLYKITYNIYDEE